MMFSCCIHIDMHIIMILKLWLYLIFSTLSSSIHDNITISVQNFKDKDISIKLIQLFVCFFAVKLHSGAYPSWSWVRGTVQLDGSPAHHWDTQRHTTILGDSLESPVNLTACFWMVGGSRRTRREPGENPERTHAYTGRTCPHRKNQPGSEPGTLCCEETVLTTVQPPVE